MLVTLLAGGRKGCELVEVDEIKSLIEVFERTTLSELELRRGETRLTLKRELSTGQIKASTKSDPISSTASASSPEQASDSTSTDESAAPSIDGFAIEAPIVGTFYRRPAPEEDPYVEVGDRINPGDTVCIVEAMKVMNEVRTERAGVVKEVLLDDGNPVEYGQPLIILDVFES
jgi:acetyl-CoA carboxylase biotin carboxyl carrier protein